jgi:hypothetical protein
LLSELVLFQPVSKSKNGGLIRQAAKLLELGKLSVQRGVKEGLFHGWIRKCEPLLHEMCAQHGLKAKRWSASPAFGVVGGDQLDQRRPGHDLIHLLQKLAFAGFLEVQAQSKGCLLHDEGFSQMWLAAGINFWELCRGSLEP